MPTVPIHIRPTAPLAERVLLPGDPGRALTLAQALLREPRMFNHHRGLWGYTGTTPDGSPLTIQSTGMGGPSAAIVLHELIALGLVAAIRVGTCGALDDTLTLGEVVVAGGSLAQDGTSRALGGADRVDSDPTLCRALEEATGKDAQTIVSTDLFYEPRGDREAAWISAGAHAVEMEAATLFTLGRDAGIAVGCLLVVSDTLTRGRTRIEDEDLARASIEIGRIAIHALTRERTTPPGP